MTADPGDVNRRRVVVRRTVGVLALASALWSINLQLRSDGQPDRFQPPVAVDEGPPFEVVGSFDHDPVYAFEIGAPSRIIRVHPRTGEVDEVRSIPSTEQVNGLALRPGNRELAVLWSNDVHVQGIGLAILDVVEDDWRVVVPAAAGRFLLDPLWDGDRLLTTQVVVDDGVPTWSVVAIEVETGKVVPLAGPATATPALLGGELWFLRVDVDGNGRVVTRVGPNDKPIDVLSAEGELTIDHLMAVPGEDRLRIAAHQVEDGGLVVGRPAGAHIGPSRWFQVAADGRFEEESIASDTHLDALSTDEDTLVFVTRHGLFFSDGRQRTEVARSRALLFVAG